MSDENKITKKTLETAEYIKDKNRDDVLRYRSNLTDYLIKAREFIDEVINENGIAVYNVSSLDQTLILIGRMYYRIRVMEKKGIKFLPSDEINICDNLKLMNLIGHKYTEEYKELIKGKPKAIQKQYDHCMALNLNYLKFISDACEIIYPDLENLEIEIEDDELLYDALNNIGQLYYCVRKDERDMNIDYEYDDEYAKKCNGKISVEDLEVFE